eukprot:NP_508665.2 Uncharacterized protein CELE_K03C7.3 [Caenorhabditis elegans]
MSTCPRMRGLQKRLSDGKKDASFECVTLLKSVFCARKKKKRFFLSFLSFSTCCSILGWFFLSHSTMHTYFSFLCTNSTNISPPNVFVGKEEKDPSLKMLPIVRFSFLSLHSQHENVSKRHLAPLGIYFRFFFLRHCFAFLFFTEMGRMMNCCGDQCKCCKGIACYKKIK